MRRSWVAAVAACGLGACGGGSGGFSERPLPLSSKQDVVRELGNVSDFVGFGDGDAKAARPARAGRVHWSHLRPGRNAWAKATTTQACDGGGTVQTDDGRAGRAFELFPVTRTVDFTRMRYRDCTESDSFGDRFTSDGVYEFGLASSDDYGYSAAGRDGEPFKVRAVYAEANGGPLQTDSAFVGLDEYRVSGDFVEDREIVRAEYTDSEGYRAELELGDGTADPLVTTEGSGSFRIDGPYRYATSACDGGSVRLQTLAAITFNGSTGYPNGGRLRLLAGGAAATVTINLDGSATVELPTGGTAAIGAAEMRDLYDGGGDC